MRPTRQEIIIGLFLCWLALTGGYAGWGNAYTLAANFLLWLGLMVWLAVKSPRIDALGWAMVSLIAATVASAALTGQWYHGLIQAAVWTGYMAVYALARVWPGQVINRAALGAFVACCPLALGGWGENSNVIAFNLVGLALLAWPVAGWGVLLPALGAAAWLNSLGAGLALGVALLVLLPRYRLALAGLAAPLFVWDWLTGPQAWAIRLGYLADAWRNFAAAPWLGLGPGTYESSGYWHAHNMVATTAAELGLLGLAALAGLVWAVARQWPALPLWAVALLLAFAAWSLVDEPLRFWGPGAMVMMALSRGGSND